MSKEALSSRSLALLRSLIEHYIRDGQPVGSKVLAQESQLMVSSATVRHIMSDLEQSGYLCAPHTSAGRVPTAQGYRLFIDHFLTTQPLAGSEVERIKSQLAADKNAQALVADASALLSNITQLAGVVTLPKQDELIFKQIEFLPLSANRVLVILVLNHREVQNRVILTQQTYTRSELEQAANYLTKNYTGQNLAEVREHLLQAMQCDRQQLDTHMQLAIDVAAESFNAQSQDYILSGEEHLLDAVAVDDIQKLRDLFGAFSQKRDILHLLDQCLNTQGVKIFVGEESGHAVFDDYSLVTAPYKVNGNVVGVMGVIGPTRMPYNEVISAVDVTAKLLSQALNG